MKKNNEYIKKQKKDKRRIIFYQISLFVGFIIIWEVFSRVNIIDEFLFSKPSSILKLIIHYYQL